MTPPPAPPRAGLTLLLAAACAGPGEAGVGAGVGAGAGADTGAAEEDQGAGLHPPLDPSPAWTSADRGVATGLGWADLDRDGDPDLVVAYGNDMAPGPVVVYENRGGALEPEPGWRSDEEHFHGHLSLGDVDGDGWTDLAVSLYLGDGSWGDPGGVHVYRNAGGALEGTPSWRAEGFHSFSCALGDVDRDGDLDLAAAAGEAYQGVAEAVWVFENDGAGGFGEAPAWTAAAPGASYDLAWLDQDADGHLDLAVAYLGRPHALYPNLGGRLDPAPAWEAPGEAFEGNTLDWGDVDGDGWLDLVVSDNLQQGGAGTVRLFCGPDLAPCWESADPPAYQSAVSLEDVDGDGWLDLVAGAWWGEVRVYRSDRGALEAEPGWRSEPDGVVVEAFGWADVDGSHARDARVSGEGLVAVPGRGRVVAVEGGVAGDGWVSGPGRVSATYRVAAARDLAVSDWTRGAGNLLFSRAARSESP